MYIAEHDSCALIAPDLPDLNTSGHLDECVSQLRWSQDFDGCVYYAMSNKHLFACIRQCWREGYSWMCYPLTKHFDASVRFYVNEHHSPSQPHTLSFE